ncbi:MAG TPA: glycosyltransferase family 4 protein [Pirellulales bacterium]|nr:glycosyltransferase family 4 protein [Pirellulales bacterium]
MTTGSEKIAYLTAGAAGMFCGSCLRDNALAAALGRLGCDVTLVPLYTPIRTDEVDVSLDRVFFGGVNVYLQQKIPLFRYVPRALDRWLDAPWLLRRLAAGNIEIDARELGEMTESMLKGEHGHQRKEVLRLVDWLAREVQPDLVNLTNILVAGCVPTIKQRLNVPVLVTLQGDDLFLEQLAGPYKQRAMHEIRRLAREIDGFVVFSRYYADFMSDYLQLERNKFHVVPLGLSLDDFHLPKASPIERPPTIGYLARIAPEKGFHKLIDAFLLLAQRPGMETVHLRAAGWLGGKDEAFYGEQLGRLRAAGLAERFRYDGVVERAEKLSLLRSIDVLSVPTTYQEPKGIFVLEAWAAGVPVVQPAHGAFPEMLAATGGGRLVEPDNTPALANALAELVSDRSAARALGELGRAGVVGHFSAEEMAVETLEVYRRFLRSSTRASVTRPPAGQAAR